MKIRELKKQISERLQFTDYERIVEWINKAIEQISLYNLKHCVADKVITLDGSGSYDISDYLAVKKVFNEKFPSFVRLPYEEYKILTEKAGCYAIFGTKIYIEGKDEKVYLIYVPKFEILLDDEDENIITQRYPELVIYNSLYQGFIFLEDFNNAQVEKQRFESRLLEIMRLEREAFYKNYQGYYL